MSSTPWTCEIASPLTIATWMAQYPKPLLVAIRVARSVNLIRRLSVLRNDSYAESMRRFVLSNVIAASVLVLIGGIKPVSADDRSVHEASTVRRPPDTQPSMPNATELLRLIGGGPSPVGEKAIAVLSAIFDTRRQIQTGQFQIDESRRIYDESVASFESHTSYDILVDVTKMRFKKLLKDEPVINRGDLAKAGVNGKDLSQPRVRERLIKEGILKLESRERILAEGGPQRIVYLAGGGPVSQVYWDETQERARQLVSPFNPLNLGTELADGENISKLGLKVQSVETDTLDGKSVLLLSFQRPDASLYRKIWVDPVSSSIVQTDGGGVHNGKTGHVIRKIVSAKNAETGVSFPAVISEYQYEADRLKFEKTMRVNKSVLNRPIDPEAFTLRGIGAAAGSVVIDAPSLRELGTWDGKTIVKKLHPR